MASAADDGDLRRMAGELRSTGIFHCDTRLADGFGLSLPELPGTVMLHAVLDGGCRIETADTAVDLECGDLAVLPHGLGHRIITGDGPVMPLAETHRPRLGGIVERLELGTSRPRTHLMCSALTLQHPAAPPLPATLDELLVVRSGADAGEISELAAMIRREVGAGAPGWVEVTSRLVDVVAMRAVRAALEHGGSEPGMWHALNDPQLAEVLRAVTDDPAVGWTVDRMARTAALSRSVFAQRFRERTGESPMTWVTGHRMRVAHARLSAGDAVSAVARATGYDSEVAFRRAFTRVTGVPPGAVRRG